MPVDMGNDNNNVIEILSDSMCDQNATSVSRPTTPTTPSALEKLEKTVEALSLISTRALCVLILWYLFSFGAIFLNKYIVDMLNAEILVFSSIHFMCGALMGLVNIYWPFDPLAHTTSGLFAASPSPPKELTDLMNRPSSYFKNMAIVGVMRFFVIFLGLVSFKYVAVSFVETVKSSAPLFTVLISFLILKERNGVFVQMSLIPIMLGLVLCTAYEISFTVIGFLAAIGTNIAECLQFVLSKLSLGGSEQHRASPAEFQFYTCTFAFLYHLPLSWFFMDMSLALNLTSGTIFLMLVNGMLYHCQTMMAWSLMQFLSPLTHSVCNTVKCALAMWLSIPLFHNQVTVLGSLGSIIVVAGVLLYNKARDFERRIRVVPDNPVCRPSTDSCS